MSTRFVMTDTVKTVEHKVAKRWLRGIGKDAEFEDSSEGYWAIFDSCPASVYLGSSKPELKAGDSVRIIMEKV